jgi:hypothetical protein
MSQPKISLNNIDAIIDRYLIMSEKKARDVDFLYEEFVKLAQKESCLEYLSNMTKTHPGISMVYRDYLMNKSINIDNYFYDDSKIHLLYTKEDIFKAIEYGTLIATTPISEDISEIESETPSKRKTWTDSELIDMNLKFSNNTERIHVMRSYKFCIKAAEFIRKLKQKNYTIDQVTPLNTSDKTTDIVNETVIDEITLERYRTKIKQQFKTMPNGWEYAFLFEEDYLLYVDILAHFFNEVPYKIVTKNIKLKNNCKTIMAETLRLIYRNCKPYGKTFKNDIDFFEIVRILEPFKIHLPEYLVLYLRKY